MLGLTRADLTDLGAVPSISLVTAKCSFCEHSIFSITAPVIAGAQGKTAYKPQSCARPQQ